MSRPAWCQCLYAVGDRVRMQRPAWRDAAGHRYPAHHLHGRVGTVVALYDVWSGSDRQISVQFDGKAGPWPCWERELRRCTRDAARKEA